MKYEPNPKHKEPWQGGRRGSLCPKEITPQMAQTLLESSDLFTDKRYAVLDGRPYCAQEHKPGLWHGYPVGWVEVPRSLRLRWLRAGKIRKRDEKRYWKG